MTPDRLSVEEKREALQRVLVSRTFARADQLRGFLRHVCEAEFEGRAHELNEYALGVAVLGRPASYSPAEDSCVRTRAYELRNKLAKYYRVEAPEDPVGIEIEKGAYVPRFARREEPSEAPPPSRPSETPSPSEPKPAEAPPPAPRARPAGAVVAAGLLAAGVLFAAGYAFRPARETPPEQAWRAPSREMDALWRPFVESKAPLLVSFELRPFFFAPETGLVVRDYRVNSAAEVASSEPLRRFQDQMGAEELRETLDYADFGAVHAVFLLGRTLDREIVLKHSRSLGWDDVWNSNVVFIGKPNLHPTVRYSLQGKDFVESEHGSAIRNLHPRPGESELYRTAETHGSGEKYALITVMPGPQPGRRFMILSGPGAEVMWALAEAVTDPERVKKIIGPVLEPSGKLASAFQVVISATFQSNVPIKIGYVTHRVSKLEK